LTISVELLNAFRFYWILVLTPIIRH